MLSESFGVAYFLKFLVVFAGGRGGVRISMSISSFSCMLHVQKLYIYTVHTKQRLKVLVVSIMYTVIKTATRMSCVKIRHFY